MDVVSIEFVRLEVEKLLKSLFRFSSFSNLYALHNSSNIEQSFFFLGGETNDVSISC